MLIPATLKTLLLPSVFIPNCFLGILVQREIIANASLMVSGFLPRTERKGKQINLNLIYKESKLSFWAEIKRKVVHQLPKIP